MICGVTLALVCHRPTVLNKDDRLAIRFGALPFFRRWKRLTLHPEMPLEPLGPGLCRRLSREWQRAADRHGRC
jgi:hypothetical protein